MATRNPANEIEFNSVNFGATISVYNVGGMAVNPETQVAPGEDMELLVEAIQQRGTTIGFGSVTVTAGAPDTHDFNVYVEGSSWEVADLEAAITAITSFSDATVTEAGL